MREIRHIMEQLDGLGLGPNIPAIEEFIHVTEEYVRTGKGLHGMIPLNGTDRVIVYELEEKRDKTCHIILKHMA